MNIDYRKAVREDAEMLIEIYNAAFYEDYVRYGECPAYGRTKERMTWSIEHYPKYIIYENGIPVGVLSFEDKGNGVYYLGCLAVIPSYQGKGIGTRAFEQMLSLCPDWQRITLITPTDKEQNIRFYTEKCHFKIGEKQMDGNVEVVTFYRERNSMDPYGSQFIELMTNEQRAESLIKKYGFDFVHIPKNEIIALIKEEIAHYQAGSSEYIRLLCGYLYCLGDHTDASLIEEAKYKINMDVGCMIDIEWIDSLKNGGIEGEYVRSRKEIIENFISYYQDFTADDE